MKIESVNKMNLLIIRHRYQPVAHTERNLMNFFFGMKFSKKTLLITIMQIKFDRNEYTIFFFRIVRVPPYMKKKIIFLNYFNL